MTNLMGDIRDQPTPSESAGSTGSTTAAAGSPLANAIPDLGQTTSESALMYRPAGVQQQQQHYSNGPHGFSAQSDIPSQHGHGRAGLFNMGTMASALPHVPYRLSPYSSGQQPSYNSLAGPSSNIANQMTMSPYGTQGSTSGWIGNQQQWYVSQHIGQYYGHPVSPSPQVSLPHRTEYGYPFSGVIVGQQPHPNAHYYYQPGASFAGQTPQAHGQTMPGHYATPGTQLGVTRSVQPQYGARAASTVGSVGQGDASLDGRHNLVRGPPRKPRQSGHAIWIGNLPPQTDLMALVHHVVKEAPGLESLFLISKSNCAFANFQDEETCAAAQQKLHDSKFQSVRLVSRLRKSTVEGASGVTAPTGPAASTPPGSSTQNVSGSWEGAGGTVLNSSAEPAAAAPTKGSNAEEPKSNGGPAPNGMSVMKDRYFVLKSLTVEDLELSVQTSVWATQSHNEEVLNNAFKNADNVYLIFSANKSGEYFGYARMTSPIDDDPAAAIEFAPKAQPSSEVDLPKAIPTEATEFAPKGRIIDDSARGTIFWEVVREDEDAGRASQEQDGAATEAELQEASEEDTWSVNGTEAVGGESKAWGKPFRLEWVSTTRLPFYRTRGLRNPWNSNREVKIARDGTELQPVVGRKLISLFNRAQSPGLVPTVARLHPFNPMVATTHPGVSPIPMTAPAPMMAGYPPPLRPPVYHH
ncbi:YT521-B-like domain-containing protein [Pseudoneurospora amorphoporcata]|uniref:YT521-B-like domain-containing protein n=1 Tax=Pseudoneurospora amorphoporcata TaxID=241081 RepID=A0AAN6P6D5_9PEZI|nr:YT521-B-like domain-containing protein [Pseudoneurospora amorphoporcata]